jgi:hypothetical protein
MLLEKPQPSTINGLVPLGPAVHTGDVPEVLLSWSPW